MLFYKFAEMLLFYLFFFYLQLQFLCVDLSACILQRIIDDSKAAGHHFAYGGDRALVQHLGNGYFIPPTIIVDPPLNSFVWQEEIFGPVLCIRVSQDMRSLLVFVFTIRL
jgi:acyl-CoA reductase-like NAD-dependent aldehyde dehydrogenase